MTHWLDMVNTKKKKALCLFFSSLRSFRKLRSHCRSERNAARAAVLSDSRCFKKLSWSARTDEKVFPSYSIYPNYPNCCCLHCFLNPKRKTAGELYLHFVWHEIKSLKLKFQITQIRNKKFLKKSHTLWSEVGVASQSYNLFLNFTAVNATIKLSACDMSKDSPFLLTKDRLYHFMVRCLYPL